LLTNYVVSRSSAARRARQATLICPEIVYFIYYFGFW